MISLYFHIPFCRKKCAYCDFFSVSDENKIKNYVDCLKMEIISRKTNEEVETIFFGGGTPSILSEDLFCEIADSIKENFNISKNCEWTIECNPESFSEEKVKCWTCCGVNRLSIGIQSLNDEELKICGRAHNREQAISVLQNPILQNFSSISVDLIYGLPSQTEKSFAETLKTICGFSAVKHISLYELTLSENSKLTKISEEEIEKITENSRIFLQKNGFERYEVSNFAKYGFRCKHNENYWTGKNYLGFGAAAHSFDGENRCANSADLKYNLEFSEKLTTEQKRTEFLMLRLRFADGFLLSDFQEKFGNLGNEKYIAELQKNGLLQIKDGICKLTERGLDFADGIAGKL